MKTRFIIFISLLALVILAIVVLGLYPFVWLFEYACCLMKKINEDLNGIMQ